MAYTDDWENLMNGVFGPGGKLRFDTQKSDQQLQQDFCQAGIQLKPLQEYYTAANRAAVHTFVLNYSGVEDQQLPEAIVRIARCL